MDIRDARARKAPACGGVFHEKIGVVAVIMTMPAHEIVCCTIFGHPAFWLVQCLMGPVVYPCYFCHLKIIRMKVPLLLQNRRERGFTLVELLVVIAIVAVLALTAFMFARRGLDKASASKSLSRLRQSGAILLADAQDKNGRMQYAVDAAQADSPFLPYNIVRNAMGLEVSAARTAAGLCDIMHWDPAKLKPKDYPMNCYGVNFTTIPDEPEGHGVEWLDETITTADGLTVDVRTLIGAKVGRPEIYPLLLDSSNAKGEEVFCIREDEGGFVGLRNSGLAHGYFLDGSARQLDGPELRKAGFSRVYDNSTSPPKLRSL